MHTHDWTVPLEHTTVSPQMVTNCSVCAAVGRAVMDVYLDSEAAVLQKMFLKELCWDKSEVPEGILSPLTCDIALDRWWLLTSQTIREFPGLVSDACKSLPGVCDETDVLKVRTGRICVTYSYNDIW